MIVVADTSPINYLVLIGHIEIMPQLYVRIPDSTGCLEGITRCSDAEFSSCLGRPSPGLAGKAYLRLRNLIPHLVFWIAANVRREAIRRELSVIGTLGVLRNAARAGLRSLPEALSQLQETNFYVAAELIQSLLDEDGARLKSI